PALARRTRARLPLFIVHAPAPTAPAALSLHDALPIFEHEGGDGVARVAGHDVVQGQSDGAGQPSRDAVHQQGGQGGEGVAQMERDRKSTRLNSSHVSISYAVFCLKTKKTGGVKPGSVS